MADPDPDPPELKEYIPKLLKTLDESFQDERSGNFGLGNIKLELSYFNKIEGNAGVKFFIAHIGGGIEKEKTNKITVEIDSKNSLEYKLGIAELEKKETDTATSIL